MRLLPEGGHPDPLAATTIPATLAARLAHMRNRGPMRFSPQARHAWPDIYAAMAECHPGLLGGILARAEAHVVRLSLLYALIDGAVAIDLEHLGAALALWDYSARSVAMIFGAASGNPLAEQIHAALVASGGLTRTDVRDLFNRNQPQTIIDAALAELARAGRAHPARVVTDGRPAQLWHATTPSTPQRA